MRVACCFGTYCNLHTAPGHAMKQPATRRAAGSRPLVAAYSVSGLCAELPDLPSPRCYVTRPSCCRWQQGRSRVVLCLKHSPQAAAARSKSGGSSWDLSAAPSCPRVVSTPLSRSRGIFCRWLGGDRVPQYWGKPSPYTEGTAFLGTPPNHQEVRVATKQTWHDPPPESSCKHAVVHHASHIRPDAHQQ